MRQIVGVASLKACGLHVWWFRWHNRCDDCLFSAGSICWVGDLALLAYCYYMRLLPDLDGLRRCGLFIFSRVVSSVSMFMGRWKLVRCEFILGSGDFKWSLDWVCCFGTRLGLPRFGLLLVFELWAWYLVIGFDVAFFRALNVMVTKTHTSIYIYSFVGKKRVQLFIWKGL